MKQSHGQQRIMRLVLGFVVASGVTGCQSPHLSSVPRVSLPVRTVATSRGQPFARHPSAATLAAHDSSKETEERLTEEIQEVAFLQEQATPPAGEVVAEPAPAAAPAPEAPAPVSPAETVAPIDSVVEEAATGWTLGQIESLALNHNPAIQQATASAHKAMGYRDQVGRKPNPLVGYNATQLADQGTDQHTAFIEQDYVTADKLCRNESVLNQEVQSQLWEVETQRQRVLTDVRQQFYAALAAQRRYELALEFEEVVRKGVTTAEARLQALEGSRTDLLQSEIQLNQVQVQRQQAEANLRSAWRQLVAVAGIPEQTPQPLVGELPAASTARNWDQIRDEILAASPELQGARARLARAQSNVDRQQAQATPNVSFMLAAGHDRGTGSGLINAQIGMPIPFHNANEGNISAAHAEFCRASRDVQRTELAIQSRLAAAQGEYESAAAAVDNYRTEVLPRANETLKLVEQAHAGGEFDFLQVLVARRTYFDANREFVQAQADLAQATCLIEGQLLTGGLDDTRDTEFDDGLRGQALSGQ